MKKEKWFFYILFAICISGFVFAVYYGREINIYFRFPIVGREENIFGLITAFLNFYYEAAKIQLLIFLCSFTVFSAPVGIILILYAGMALGSSAYVICERQASSFLYLSILPYTFIGAISLYLYVEMVYRGYGYSVSIRNKTAPNKIIQSRTTRSYISSVLLMSALILIAEISRYFIIIQFDI